ncbi:unnamed protein product [Choristocarpus tenellus]
MTLPNTNFKSAASFQTISRKRSRWPRCYNDRSECTPLSMHASSWRGAAWIARKQFFTPFVGERIYATRKFTSRTTGSTYYTRYLRWDFNRAAELCTVLGLSALLFTLRSETPAALEVSSTPSIKKLPVTEREAPMPNEGFELALPDGEIAISLNIPGLQVLERELRPDGRSWRVLAVDRKEKLVVSIIMEERSVGEKAGNGGAVPQTSMERLKAYEFRLENSVQCGGRLFCPLVGGHMLEYVVEAEHDGISARDTGRWAKGAEDSSAESIPPGTYYGVPSKDLPSREDKPPSLQGQGAEDSKHACQSKSKPLSTGTDAGACNRDGTRSSLKARIVEKSGAKESKMEVITAGERREENNTCGLRNCSKNVRLFLDVGNVAIDLHLHMSRWSGSPKDDKVLQEVLNKLEVLRDFEHSPAQHLALGTYFFYRNRRAERAMPQLAPWTLSRGKGSEGSINEGRGGRGPGVNVPEGDVAPPGEASRTVSTQKEDMKQSLRHFRQGYETAKRMPQGERGLREEEWRSLVNHYGVLASSQEGLDRAAEVFEGAVIEDPHHPTFRYNLSCVYAEMGRREDMLRELETALTLRYRQADSERQQMADPLKDLAFRNFWRDPKLLRLVDLHLRSVSC